jgi:hypothetical protein
MSGRRVLVCGGRHYADREHAFTSLDRVKIRRLKATEPSSV